MRTEFKQVQYWNGRSHVKNQLYRRYIHTRLQKHLQKRPNSEFHVRNVPYRQSVHMRHSKNAIIQTGALNAPFCFQTSYMDIQNLPSNVYELEGCYLG